MEASELRIGNYMGFGHDVVRVYEINEDKFYCFQDDETSLSSKWADLQPILLTEEWLLKLGYKYFQGKTEGTLTMDFEGKLDIDYHEGEIKVKSHYEGDYLYRKLFNIKYVHQLQNLYFALCGEELLLKDEQ